ncbi:MAG: Crp/Fnr family transcriptional regulator [Thermoanaerobaculum sp.]
MLTAEAKEVVLASPLLKGLDGAAQDEVLGLGASRKLRRGQVLFRQRDPAQALYVVAAGKVKLVQEDSFGHQVVVRFVGPGQVMAAVALTPGHVYPVTAQAVEETTVVAWAAEVLRELGRRYPALTLAATAEIAAHMRDMQERFLELASERVEQRLARCLLRLARQVGKRVPGGVLLDVPLSRQDLAAMTGATLYTVSRILSHWESQGILRAGRQKVLITSPHGLVAVAEDLPEGGTP